MSFLLLFCVRTKIKSIYSVVGFCDWTTTKNMRWDNQCFHFVVVVFVFNRIYNNFFVMRKIRASLKYCNLFISSAWKKSVFHSFLFVVVQLNPFRNISKQQLKWCVCFKTISFVRKEKKIIRIPWFLYEIMSIELGNQVKIGIEMEWNAMMF